MYIQLMQDGDFKATGSNQAANDEDPAATGMMQGTQSCSSLPTQAPDNAPPLKKFTSFCYQIASGMVSL